MSNFFQFLSVSENDNNIFKNISREFKIAFGSTIIIGLIAHIFVFINPIFQHDASFIYWETLSFGQASANSRWLVPLWMLLFRNVFQPWLCGFLTLVFYGISSYFICRYFDISRTLSIVFVSGLLVTAPTVISSNMYLSSAYIYAAALMLSVLSAYCYDKVKHGWILGFVFMFLCGGTYAAYISFGVSLFILRKILTFINGELPSFKTAFINHIGYCIISGAALVANVAVLVIFGKQESIRGTTIASNSKPLFDIIYDFFYYGIQNYFKTINYFLPTGKISYMQQAPVFYALFCIAAALTLFLCIYIVVKNKLYKKFVTCILLADVLILPFAMDILGAVAESHLLMQGAFILPVLMIIFVYEAICKNNNLIEFLHSVKNKVSFGMVYTSIIFIFALFTIANRTQLANVAYTKAYLNYQAGVNHANRIVMQVENTEGYIPGQTKVMFVGVIKHSDHGGAFKFADDITGIGSPIWDTSIIGTYSLKAFINQILNVDMDIIDTLNYVDGKKAEEFLVELDPAFKGISGSIDALDAYSTDNCYILQNDVLILKISERQTY